MPHRSLFILFSAALLCGCLQTMAPKPEPQAPDAVQVLPSSSDGALATVAPEAALPASTPVEILPSTGAPETTATPLDAPLPAVETAPGTTDSPGSGRIIRVNEKLGYVLIEASGRFNTGQPVVVLRNGEAVGKLSITAPRLRPYLSADIVDGRPQPGDQVR
jgi:hypothetical protein